MAVCKYYTDDRYNLNDADYLKFLYDNWPLLVRLAYTHWPPAGAAFQLQLWRDKPLYGFVALMDILMPMQQKLSRMFNEISQMGKVGLVLGRKNSGKSYATAWLARQVGLNYGRWICHTGFVKMPGFYHVPESFDAKSGSLTIVDEAQLLFDSRRSTSHANVDETQGITIIRHADKSTVYISQEARLLDTRMRSQSDWMLVLKMGRGRHLTKTEATAIKEIIPEAHEHMLPKYHGRALFLGDSGIFTVNIPGPNHPDGLHWWTNKISKSYSLIRNEKQAREIVRILLERDPTFKEHQIIRRLKLQGWRAKPSFVKQTREDVLRGVKA